MANLIFFSSVNTLTFLLDVFAGILVMLGLWRISNADEYLMRLTMVSLEN